jgi:hypothetical protein
MCAGGGRTSILPLPLSWWLPSSLCESDAKRVRLDEARSEREAVAPNCDGSSEAAAAAATA